MDGRQLEEGTALLGSALGAEAAGDLHLAWDYASEALGLFEELGDGAGRADTLHLLARLCCRERRLDEAEAHLVDAIGACVEVGELPGQAVLLDDLFGVRLERGEPASAYEASGRLLEVLEQLGDQAAHEGAHHRHLHLAALLASEGGDPPGD